MALVPRKQWVAFFVRKRRNGVMEHWPLRPLKEQAGAGQESCEDGDGSTALTIDGRRRYMYPWRRRNEKLVSRSWPFATSCLTRGSGREQSRAEPGNQDKLVDLACTWAVLLSARLPVSGGPCRSNQSRVKPSSRLAKFQACLSLALLQSRRLENLHVHASRIDADIAWLSACDSLQGSSQGGQSCLQPSDCQHATADQPNLSSIVGRVTVILQVAAHVHAAPSRVLIHASAPFILRAPFFHFQTALSWTMSLPPTGMMMPGSKSAMVSGVDSDSSIWTSNLRNSPTIAKQIWTNQKKKARKKSAWPRPKKGRKDASIHPSLTLCQMHSDAVSWADGERAVGSLHLCSCVEPPLRLQQVGLWEIEWIVASRVGHVGYDSAPRNVVAPDNLAGRDSR